MNIGFDAKRAFHNTRGLGNYSRDTIRLMGSFYRENNYFLFNPKKSTQHLFEIADNMTEIIPSSFIGKAVPSLWRSTAIPQYIPQFRIDIYHGLSQELPWGIDRKKVKKIVTMHDAIFMRFPELYPALYRSVFIQKNRFACKVADRIIAISQQTKADIIRYFNVDEQKIDIVYQGCNPVFMEPVPGEIEEEVREKYKLPERYILTVGSIEKRKNAEVILKALHLKKIDIPFFIVGKPTGYIKTLYTLIENLGLSGQVHFIHDADMPDLPALYSLATLFVFPSLFEGFGIPILEALCRSVPVIASKGTCFEEVGGPSSLYLDPTNVEEWAEGIDRILRDASLQSKMKTSGLVFSENFSDEVIARNLMKVYEK